MQSVTQKLKIAMLSVHSCPIGQLGGKDTGGMNVYIRELAYELGRRGHTIDIYTRAHDPKDDQVVKLSQNVRLIHLKAGEVEDMPKLVHYSYLSDFACSLENFRKQNNLHYDLIHSHYWLSGQVGKWLEGWWNVPCIIMFHTLGMVKNLLEIGEVETELRIETEKELVRNYQRIIAATEKEKKDLIHYYQASPETISVIPCGVNLELFQHIDKKIARQELGLADGNIILFVGRIERLKGIDELLRAMPYLKKRSGLRLLIIGGDGYSQVEVEKLKILSRNLCIQDSISFLGSVPQRELPLFYSAADVCVSPSYYESFGLVALESLACGTPVVATSVGGATSFIRQSETGYVIDDNAPSHLAEKMDLLLSTPKTDAEYASSIRASVEQFNWSNIAEAIIREYRMSLTGYLTQVS